MSNSTKHEELGKKLRLLYKHKLHVDINNHADLAKNCGISRQAISKWIHGTDTSQGDRIPLNQVRVLADLFGIPSQWLSLKLADFSCEILSMLERKSEHKPNYYVSSLADPPEMFVGREEELRLLDAVWATQLPKVVQVVGFAGSGKTALVAQWLKKAWPALAADETGRPPKIYVWKFDQGCQFDLGKSVLEFEDFLNHALVWFEVPRAYGISRHRKVELLVQAIKRNSVLLVLDGVESLLSLTPIGRPDFLDTAMSRLFERLMFDGSCFCILVSRLPVRAGFPRHRGRIRTLAIAPLTEGDVQRFLECPEITTLGFRNEAILGSLLQWPLFLQRLNAQAGLQSKFIREEGPRNETSLFYSVVDSDIYGLGKYYESLVAQSDVALTLLLLGVLNVPITRALLQQLADFVQLEASLILGKEPRKHDVVSSLELLRDYSLISVRPESGDHESRDPEEWGDIEVRISLHPLMRYHFLQKLAEPNPNDFIFLHGRIFESLVTLAGETNFQKVETELIERIVRHAFYSKRLGDALVYCRELIRRGNTSVLDELQSQQIETSRSRGIKLGANYFYKNAK